jgi:hypothetical protein
VGKKPSFIRQGWDEFWEGTGIKSKLKRRSDIVGTRSYARSRGVEARDHRLVDDAPPGGIVLGEERLDEEKDGDRIRRPDDRVIIRYGRKGEMHSRRLKGKS